MTNAISPNISHDGYPMLKAYLPAKKHRRIGKARAVNQRTVKLVRIVGDEAHVLVLRGSRWQNETIKRELLV